METHYMKEICLKEFQDLYKTNFYLLCKMFKKNNLFYSLAYGSLLGAIRDSDIIKWDNDIDLWMNENDVLKVKEVISKSDQFFYKSYRDYEEVYGVTRVYCKNIFRQLPGEEKPRYAYFDIFDFRVTDDIESAKKIYNKNLHILKLISFKKQVGMKSIKNLIKKFLSLFIPSKKALISKMSSNFSGLDNGNKFMVVKYPEHSFYTFEYSGEFIKVKFGSEYCTCFKNYDVILRARYGDYLVPVDYHYNDGVRFFKN